MNGHSPASRETVPAAVDTTDDIAMTPRAAGADPSGYRDAYMHAHRAGAWMWIDMAWVPPARRRQGVGRALYRDWESALPADITHVLVFAADTGQGPSDAFWSSLGFEYRWDAIDPETLPYEMRQQMWKGVNGHPTPAPQPVDEEEP